MTDSLQQLLDSMTLEEKIGQLFLLAFSKDRLDEARILFEEHFVGASYLSNDNVPTPEAALDLTRRLQQFAASTRLKIPLLLGVDQEGAWGVMVPGSCTGPGNMALGATGRPKDAFAMYEVIGRELASVGLNAVFAPSADCNSNPYNSIIGMRSFGEKPSLVAAMTAAAVRGAHSGGVIATIKHFPGHGDTTSDTHRDLAAVKRSREELAAIDLYPFAEGIRAGADIVMTAHILFPAIDAKNPATLSRIILQDLLRGQMGFQGVILSDSMNMQAMTKNYALEDAAIQALNAGVDVIMLAEEHYSHDATTYLRQQTLLLTAVKQAVQDGRLPLERVDDATTRVLTLKRKFGLLPGEFDDQRFSASNVGGAANRAVELNVSRHAVAVLRDTQMHVPIDPAKSLTLVNTTLRASYDILGATRGIGPNQMTPAFDYFATALGKRYPNVTILSAEQVLAGAFPADGLIVAVTENYPLPGTDFDQSSQPHVIRRLHERAADRLVVVALRDPYELTTLPSIETYVCAFSFRPAAAQAVVDVLSGIVPPSGDTPVSVPGTAYSARDVKI
jgi:beta-N-acetylhexosaminidase